MSSLSELEYAYLGGANTNPSVPGVDVVPPSPPNADVLNVTLAAATSTQLFASSPLALGRAIYNASTQPVYVKFGTGASATSFTTMIPNGGYYEVPFGYDGVIHGFSTAAGTAPGLMLTTVRY